MKMLLSSRRTQSPSQLFVKFEAFVSRINCITLIIFYLLFSLFRDTVTDYSLMMSVSICMKLDPDIHIAMHSVLSLKPSVTDVISELYRL